jgi:hypothetical protein
VCKDFGSVFSGLGDMDGHHHLVLVTRVFIEAMYSPQGVRTLFVTATALITTLGKAPTCSSSWSRAITSAARSSSPAISAWGDFTIRRCRCPAFVSPAL